MKPFWQSQENDPSALIHAPFSQWVGSSEHSLISVQFTPSPVNPLSQMHRKLPGVFRQCACESHPPLLFEHSFMSYFSKEKIKNNC